MKSKKAMIADWSKQAKKKSNNYWGGRKADGIGDNYDQTKFQYTKKYKTPNSTVYIYPKELRRKWRTKKY